MAKKVIKSSKDRIFEKKVMSDRKKIVIKICYDTK